jgi:hypothetical protein
MSAFFSGLYGCLGVMTGLLVFGLICLFIAGLIAAIVDFVEWIRTEEWKGKQ